MSENVGYATLSLIPSARGFAAKLKQATGPATDDAGKEGGARFGKALIGTLGALGIGASITGALLDGLDAQAATAKLGVQLGASGPVAAKAGKMAGDLYAGAYGDSMDQVREAVTSVAQNITGTGAIGSKSMQDLTANVLTVSNAFDQDLGGVTRAVGQLMKTGMAKNGQEALDIITTGFQNGSNKADDLLDTFNEYGTQFRKLGIDGPKALGLINQGIQAGARDSDKVADAIKEFSIRAVDGSDLTATSFKAIGLNASKMAEQIGKGGPTAEKALGTVLAKLRAVKDPAKQAQIATGLFGTQAEDLGAALFALNPSTAVKGLGDFSGAAQRATDTIGSTGQANIDRFTRSLRTGFVQVLGGKVIPGLQQLQGWVSSNQQPITIIAGIITALLVPSLILWSTQSTIAGAKAVWAWLQAQGAAIKTVATHVISVARIVAGWVLMGVQSLLQAGRMAAAWFIALGPVGWAIAAIVAIAVIVIANWDKIVGWTKKAWSAVSSWVTSKASQAMGWLRSNWPLILAILTGPIGLAVLYIVRNWDKITAGAARMKAAVVGKLHELVGFVKSIPGRITSALGNLGGLLVDKGSDIVSGLIQGISNMGGRLAGFVKRFVADHIPGPVAKALGIASPSKVMAAQAKWIPLGIIEGIDSQRSKLDDTMAGLVKSPSLPALDKSAVAAQRAGVPERPISVKQDFHGITDPEEAAAASVNRLTFAVRLP